MRVVVERNDSGLGRTLEVRMLNLRSEVDSLVIWMWVDKEYESPLGRLMA